MSECTDPKYLLCPNPSQDRDTAYTSKDSLTHSKTRDITTNIGGVSVTLQSRRRAFSLTTGGSWNKQDYFLFPLETGYGECFTLDSTTSASISEDYECVDTILVYLNLRYGLALCKEVKQTLRFSKTTDDMAAFKGTWGTMYVHKFRLNEVNIETETTWYAIYGGGKHIFETQSSTYPLHTRDEPLILVWPQPPSLAIVLDEEIKQYGFYDYRAEGDQSRIQKDGGDDYYYTDWLRACGGTNQTQDQADADLRYFAYFLRDPVTAPTPSLSLALDPTPQGSICQLEADDEDLVCLSWLDYHFITDGDLPTITETEGESSRFYPVGVI